MKKRISLFESTTAQLYQKQDLRFGGMTSFKIQTSVFAIIAGFLMKLNRFGSYISSSGIKILDV